jgi:hypothetical protein
MSVYCGFVDVSHHTRNDRGKELDWPAIAAAGLGTVMAARATYGDPQIFNPSTFFFGEFMDGAKAAGFSCRGGYHNVIRGDAASMARQVDLLRRELDRHNVEWPMADIERYDELVENGLWPRFDDVLRFQDRWYAVEDRVIAWYIPLWDWRDHLGQPDLTVLHGPLIGSAYEDNAHLPWQKLYEHEAPDGVRAFESYGGRMPEIGQIGSHAIVPGSGPNTDVNIYRGPVDDLVALLTGAIVITDADAKKIADAVKASFLGASGPTAAVAWQSTYQLVQQIATKVDIDPAELDAIKQAAQEGAHAGALASVDAFVAAVVAKLPRNGLTEADVETAVRAVFADAANPG